MLILRRIYILRPTPLECHIFLELYKNKLKENLLKSAFNMLKMSQI